MLREQELAVNPQLLQQPEAPELSRLAEHIAVGWHVAFPEKDALAYGFAMGKVPHVLMGRRVGNSCFGCSDRCFGFAFRISVRVNFALHSRPHL